MDKNYETKKRWRKNNPERAREIARDWVKRQLEKDPDSFRKKARERAINYYYRHHSKVRQKDNERQRLNRTKDVNAYNAKQREYRKTHPEKFKQYLLKRKEQNKIFARIRLLAKYGLTQESFNHLLESQDNKCAICKNAFNGRIPKIDHSHITSKTRGLLCDGCNIILGYAEKQIAINSKIIENMVIYLDFYK